MKVEIIEPTIAQKRQVMPGDVLDLQPAEAFVLIGASKAVAVKDVAIETAIAPSGENTDPPKPPKGGKKLTAPKVDAPNPDGSVSDDEH